MVPPKSFRVAFPPCSPLVLPSDAVLVSERMAAAGGDLAVSALVSGSTLLCIALQAPRADQVETFARLSSLNKALQRAGAVLWRELCLARWPSSRAFESQPFKWRLFALVRSAADKPRAQRAWRGAPPWRKEDLLLFDGRSQKLMLLLDVFDCDRAVFSARLGFDTSDSYLLDGIVADEDDAAEEFMESHQQLHLSDNAIQAFPRLLLLQADQVNRLDECLVRAVEEWNDDGSEEASSGHKQAPTAQLCVVDAGGNIAVLHLGGASSDRRVGDHFRASYLKTAEDEDEGSPELFAEEAPPASAQRSPLSPPVAKRWQENPSGMLRWARTLSDSSGSGEAGFDCILNVYCLGEAVVVVDMAADGDEPAELGAEEAAPASDEDSDVSAGEEAVREVAADRDKRLQRLRDALRAHDAERALLSRALAECMENRTDGARAGGNDDDLADFLSDGDVQASPRRSNSSQRSHTTLSDTDTSSDGTESAPTEKMRLSLASLSLGWIPAGDVGAALLRSKREAFAVEHKLPITEIDDERELSEGEEDAVKEAEAAHFWAKLDAQMPWYRR